LVLRPGRESGAAFVFVSARVAAAFVADCLAVLSDDGPQPVIVRTSSPVAISNTPAGREARK
jgi:hypothetical protein